MAIPLSLPAILTVVIFTFTLTLQEFVYALTFVSSSSQKPVTLGVLDRPDPRRRVLLGGDDGRCVDCRHPGGGCLNLFLDRFIPGITGGAVNNDVPHITTLTFANEPMRCAQMAVTTVRSTREALAKEALAKASAAGREARISVIPPSTNNVAPVT